MEPIGAWDAGFERAEKYAAAEQERVLSRLRALAAEWEAEGASRMADTDPTSEHWPLTVRHARLCRDHAHQVRNAIVTAEEATDER